MRELTNAEVIAAWSQYPEDLIEGFGEEGDLIRQYLLNPTIFQLLGEVKGKRVLDAGCGQGYLCRLLAKRGARMTGVEPAEAFIKYALRREENDRLGIEYVQADLSTWTPPPEFFDVVIANMVLMDIPDYESALKNCVVALADQGGLIISLLHPCFEETGAMWKEKGEVSVRDYFRERAVKQDLGYFIHRPLGTYLNSIISAGCLLQKIIEPQLEYTVAQSHQAERYWFVPGYLVIFATRCL